MQNQKIMTKQTKTFIITSIIATILSFLISSYTNNTDMVAPVFAATLIVGLILTKRHDKMTKEYLPMLILGTIVLLLFALIK